MASRHRQWPACGVCQVTPQGRSRGGPGSPTELPLRGQSRCAAPCGGSARPCRPSPRARSRRRWTGPRNLSQRRGSIRVERVPGKGTQPDFGGHDMLANSLFATSIFFLALLLFLLGECTFLAPYRVLLIDKYGTTIITFLVVLFLNVFAAVYLGARKLFLKDTGRKLAHVEKQIRTGSSISEELTQRLRDQKEGR